jgi:hypothetical protein
MALSCLLLLHAFDARVEIPYINSRNTKTCAVCIRVFKVTRFLTIEIFTIAIPR